MNVSRKPDIMQLAKIKATINSIKINQKGDIPLKSAVKKVYLNFPLNKPCISSKAAVYKRPSILTDANKTKNLLQARKNLISSPIKTSINRKQTPVVNL
jgi:hypothetical protein